MKLRFLPLVLSIVLSITLTISMGLILGMRVADAQPLTDPDALSITAVSPDSVPNDLDTSLIIIGTDFINGASVYVDGVELQNVTWINSTQLEAVLPWGLNPDTYTLTVTNPGGESASLPDAISVFQGINVWTKANGPEGGSVIKVAVNPLSPNILLAIPYNGGLFRSLDSGATWALSLDQVAYKPSLSLGVDGQTVYVASHGRLIDIWRSDDNGASWHPIPIPDVDGKFIVYAHPTQADVVFVIVESQGWNGNALYKSDNRGTDWELITEGLTGVAPTALGIDPINPLIMALGTTDGDVYLSTDGGLTWDFASQALAEEVGEVTFHPSGNGEVWVNGVECGVVKSNNPDLTSWTDVQDGGQICFGWQQDYLHLAPSAWGDPYDDTLFYVGQSVRMSSNGGLTWSNWGGWENGGALSLALHPSDPDTVYVGSKRLGVQVTHDNGNTWQLLNNGMTGLIPEVLSVMPDHPEIVYGQDMESVGVYRLDQGGASWDYLPVEPFLPLGAIETSAMALDSFQTNRIYLARENTIFISPDSGQTWPLSATLPVPNEYDLCWNRTTMLAGDPFNSGTLVAGIQHDCEAINLDPGGLYISTDYGEDWTRITTSDPISKVTDIVYDVATSGLVYAAEGNSGVLRSYDGGLTWEAANGGLNPEWNGMLEVEPVAPYRLFYANWRNLFVSEDQGDSWTLLNTPTSIGSGIQALHYSLGEPAVLYLATGSGLYASTDGGVTWLPTPEPLGIGNVWSMSSLYFDSRTVLYAGAAGGIYRLTRAPVQLYGTVTDAVNGSPIEGALVIVDTGDSTYTNSNGEYSFILPSGTYTVTASNDGYYSQVAPNVELIMGMVELNFGLSPLPVTLTGLVSDAATNLPLPGAQVIVNSGEYTYTDSNGIYSIQLDRGVYTVTANADYYLSQSVGGVELISETVVQDFELIPDQPIPDWAQVNEDGFGNANYQISVLETFQPAGSPTCLYAGTWGASDTRIWRSTDGWHWELAGSGWLTPTAYMYDAHVFQGQLYLGLGQPAQLWRTDGDSWEAVTTDGFADSNNHSLNALMDFDGQLYAATLNDVTGVEIWSSTSGEPGSWTQANDDGFGDGSGFDALTRVVMDVFGDYLYVSFVREGAGELWRTDDGLTWELMFNDGLGDSNNQNIALAEFEGTLYIAFTNLFAGGELWRLNANEEWELVFDRGLGDIHNKRPYGLIVADNALYVVFSSSQTGVRVFRSYNGDYWQPASLDGWGDLSNTYGDYDDKAAAVFNFNLYVGTINSTAGGRIWRLQLAEQIALPFLAK